MKYWSPTEPKTLRFPKPEGVESFEVSDDFHVDAAEIIEDENGVRSVIENAELLAEVLAREANIP